MEHVSLLYNSTWVSLILPDYIGSVSPAQLTTFILIISLFQISIDVGFISNGGINTVDMSSLGHCDCLYASLHIGAGAAAVDILQKHLKKE